MAPWRFLLLFALFGSPAAGTEFVEALRARQLNRLAELRCEEALRRTNLTARQAAGYAIQLSLIEVDRATTTRTGRETHWRQAAEHLSAVPKSRGPSDVWLLLRLQVGLNQRTRGEFQQAISDPGAAGTLISAARRLAKSRDEIETLRIAGSEAFSDRELDSLAARVQVAWARSGRLLALCHPAGSADRDDALLQTTNAARAVLASNVADDVRWQAVLLLAEALRLLGRTDEATSFLQQQSDPPKSFAAALAAERWRLLRAAGRTSDARRWLESQPGKDSAELSLARIESLAERWKFASQDSRDPLAAEVQRQLIAGRKQHGGLWAARAERIAGATLTATDASDSVDAVVTTAEYQFHVGQFDKAVDAYDRAAGLAFRDGATGRAYELARTAAAIVRSQGKMLAAAERFRRAALTAAQRPDAAATHRLAIICVSEALRNQAPQEAEIATRYAELLTEHLNAWPTAPTTAEVRWWQVKWQAANGGWQAAIDPLSKVAAEDPRYPEAVRLLGQAYTQIVKETASDPTARQTLITEATAKLQPTITGADNRWPTAWTPSQRETALVLAKLHGGVYAARLLGKAIDSPPAAGNAWKRRALALLVPALVDAGETEGALQRVRTPPLSDRQTAEAVLAALESRLPTKTDPQSPAARVMLGAITATPSEGGDDDGRWKAPYAAAALATLGRTSDAVTVYRQLVERFPRDATLRLKLAKLLSGSTNVAEQQQSLQSFATVERGVAKGGDAWWDARLGRLRMLLATNQTEQAAKLLKLTKVLNPDLGGRQVSFSELEQSLKDQTAKQTQAPSP